jgi:proline iminopeptidase
MHHSCAALVAAIGLLSSACIDDRALVPPTVDEDPTLEHLDVNGTRLHVTELGTPGDPLIVFVHGGPGVDHRQFLNWSFLADEGYHLVMYDQRGAGLSRREPAATLDLAHTLGDLSALVDAERSADEPVVLFSHSWGSMMVTAFINEDPARVQGAVLVEPPGFTRAEAEEFFARAIGEIELTEGISDVLWAPQFLSPDEHAHWDYLMAAASRDSEGQEGNDRAHPAPFWRYGGAVSYWLPKQVGDDFDWTTRLAEVTYPVLWFHSTKNRVTYPEQQRALARHYPMVEQHLIENVGHDLLYQRTEELRPIVEDYLGRVTGKVIP